MEDNRVCTGACIIGKCPFETCIKHKQGSKHKAIKADMSILTHGNLAKLATDHDGYGAAVDIGTTTIAAYLYDFKSGDCIDIKSRINPQTSFGVDVISRIKYCRDNETGLGELHEAIASALNEIIGELCEHSGLENKSISKITVTGNTTMLCLMGKVDPSPMGVSPFEMPFGFGNTVKAKDIDLDFDADVYLTHCMSAFVGGDIVSAVLASGMRSQDVSLLLDIGTNGEVALHAHGKILSTSTAAGPAFEGSELSCGMAAVAGAVNGVYVANGEIKVTTIGNKKPSGICGSGVIDALALMRSSGVMDETGFIQDSPFTVEIDGITAVKVCEDVFITQKDVRKIQTAKSAIAAGVLALVNSAGLTLDNVKTVYLAGGFGNYMDENSAVTIGLLPESTLPKLKSIGNAAGAGAGMALDFSSNQKQCRQIADSSTHVELATDPFFIEKYVDCMMF